MGHEEDVTFRERFESNLTALVCRPFITANDARNDRRTNGGETNDEHQDGSDYVDSSSALWDLPIDAQIDRYLDDDPDPTPDPDEPWRRCRSFDELPGAFIAERYAPTAIEIRTYPHQSEIPVSIELSSGGLHMGVGIGPTGATAIAHALLEARGVVSIG